MTRIMEGLADCSVGAEPHAVPDLSDPALICCAIDALTGDRSMFADGKGEDEEFGRSAGFHRDDGLPGRQGAAGRPRVEL